MTDVKTTPSWTADPPEWAPYVGGVAFVEQGEVLRVSVDMRPKYLEAFAQVEGDKLAVVFEAREHDSEARILWPEGPGLGRWPQTSHRSPTVIVDLGRDLSGYEVVSCVSGRYATNVALVPRAALEVRDAQETP